MKLILEEQSEFPEVTADISVLDLSDDDIEPSGPFTPEDNGIANQIIAEINGEWETISNYNDLIVTLRQFDKTEFIPAIDDIVREENKHIGQLQQILKQLSPNVEEIQKGELEAQTQLPVNEQMYLNESTRDFDWDDVLYCVVKDDGTFAGIPCTSYEEARELAANHEGSQILRLTTDDLVQRVSAKLPRTDEQLVSSLSEATLHPKFKKRVKLDYKQWDKENDANNAKRKDIGDVIGDAATAGRKQEIIDKVYPEKDKFDPKLPTHIETKDFPYYVSIYTEYPIYEPAEGGYYYPGVNASSTYGFDSKQEARNFADDVVGDFIKDGEDWRPYGPNGYIYKSKYIGDDAYVMVETNKEYLSRESGYVPYE